MISSSTGPLGVDVTGFANGWAFSKGPPSLLKLPKNPDAPRDGVGLVVCVEDVSE